MPAVKQRKTQKPDPEPEPETTGVIDVDDDQLLDLDDLAPKRPMVRFKGDVYELRVLDDFGIEDQQAVARDAREFQELWSKDHELNSKQRSRLKMLLNRIFHRVLDAPKDIREGFNDAQRARVALFFQLAPLAAATAQTTENTEAEDSEST